jgi:hypothetical protein
MRNHYKSAETVSRNHKQEQQHPASMNRNAETNESRIQKYEAMYLSFDFESTKPNELGFYKPTS